jgi:hypothetical protein
LTVSRLLDLGVCLSEDETIQADAPAARKLIDLLGLNRPRLREFRE